MEQVAEQLLRLRIPTPSIPIGVARYVRQAVVNRTQKCNATELCIALIIIPNWMPELSTCLTNPFDLDYMLVMLVEED